MRVLGTSAIGVPYVNNHFAGNGPATVRELRARVEAGDQGSAVTAAPLLCWPATARDRLCRSVDIQYPDSIRPIRRDIVVSMAAVGVARLSARTIVLVSVISLAALGCNSVPVQTMPHEVVAELKPGSTTLADAKAALGAPANTEALPDGGQVWLYNFAPDPVPPAPGLPAPTDAHRQSETLRLVFGPTGVLLSHESSRSMLGVRDAAASWEAEHQALRDIPLN